jgi:hypothetical protein
MWILVLAAIASIASAQGSADPQPKTLIVTHKFPEFGDLKRKTFEQQVIELALAKSQKKVGSFKMVPVNVISRTHAIAALSQNLYENFVILLSYEDALVASGDLVYIPFPIELGALSYRICYANKNLTQQVQEITSLDHLKHFKIGVGAGWLDAKILHHHGVPTVEGSNITGLFRMTQAGRADLFCPSPTEYFHELKVEQATDLQLNNKLALYYPLPKFLFSHKSNQALMDQLKEGIEIAYQDGSYQRLWSAVHEEDLQRAKLNERHLIKMENPFITTLKDDYKRYLFNPLEH